VGVGTTYSMTIGQLSVYRDTQELPADKIWDSNLPYLWDLRQECTVEDVWAALGALAMRHESLRTNYLVDASGDPRQYLVADDLGTVFAMVDRGVADITELAAIKESKYKQEIDIHCGIPWRAWVFTDGGVPRKVLFIVHHIAADGAASLILQDDFHALLAGKELPPPSGQPRTMVSNEQGISARRLLTAERYWRRTLDASPRSLPGAQRAGGPMIGATLHTGIPLELAHEGAAKLDVSVASVVLAAFYHSLRQVTGRSEILLLPMSANRFDAATTTMVTTLNQRVPLLLALNSGGSASASESFAELAGLVHWKSFSALKNGICDPDAIVRIRQEFFELANPPVDPGFYFNGILAPPGFAPPVDPEPPRTEFYQPTRTTKPGFYLIAAGIERIDLVVRSNRAEFDQSSITALLVAMQKTLLEAAGLEARLETGGLPAS
jgi:Condensation domain